MKELSIEEKAKAYDKALEIAKKNYIIAQDFCEGSKIGVECFKNTLKSIFPELRKNEDDNIRKALINGFKDYKGWNEEWFDGITVREVIGWLENKGEEKGKSALEAAKEIKIDNQNCIKITDNVELKFKVGDWVVLSTSDGEKVVQIDSIEYFKSGEPMYITSEGRWFGNRTKAHLWTIQDAKDGDVLHSPSHRLIWIYKDNEHYYACVNMNYVRNISIDGLIKIPSDVCPATKIERTILFEKIKESNYD